MPISELYYSSIKNQVILSASSLVDLGKHAGGGELGCCKSLQKFIKMTEQGATRIISHLAVVTLMVANLANTK